MSKAANRSRSRRERFEREELEQSNNVVAFNTGSKQPLIRPVYCQPKNEKQQLHMDLIDECDITVAHGYAGTGKTHITCRVAAEYYRKGLVTEIWITRPNEVVGKTMGYLPGTAEEKLQFLFAPMLNDLKKAVGDHAFKYMIENKKIKIMPMEYIRGMSLGTDKEPVFIIVDEAQNVDTELMISLLTRFGAGKMVFCGDPRQKDVKVSGLEWLINHCKAHDLGIGFVKYEVEDCVRSGFVKDFLKSLLDSGYYKL